MKDGIDEVRGPGPRTRTGGAGVPERRPRGSSRERARGVATRPPPLTIRLLYYPGGDHDVGDSVARDELDRRRTSHRETGKTRLDSTRCYVQGELTTPEDPWSGLLDWFQELLGHIHDVNER